MSVLARVVLATLLLAGTAIWLPQAVSTAAARIESGQSAVRAPAAGDNDNGVVDDNDNAVNVNDNDIVDNDNGEDNDNDFNNAASVPTDPNQSGGRVQSGDLTVELWHSSDHPVAGQPFQIAVTGSGAPIESVRWWATGPSGGVAPDDLSRQGVQSLNCGGQSPCSGSWSVVARGATWYTLYARVRDTSGREVETQWYFLASENPRS